MANVPAPELAARLVSLRKGMKAEKWQAVYLTGAEDIRYFTGFTGSDAHAVLTPDTSFLLTDRRYEEEVARSAPGSELVLWKKGLAVTAGELLRKKRVGSLGVLLGELTCRQRDQLLEAAPKLRLQEAAGVLSAIRIRKSAWELGRIGAALRCAETSFRELKPVLREGMTELEVRAELELRMLRHGAEKTAFETIVAAGANASLPHAHAGRGRVRPGVPLLIDFGARIDGYNSDLTRVVFLGSMPKFWREQYALVLAAQAAGLSCLGPGKATRDADQAARDVFAKAGREGYFSHSLGHGLGLQVHEAPRLSRLSDETLGEGMLVTCEPGLYYPGRGGIRIEDMVVIRQGGMRVLSRLEKTIDSAIL